jgi:ammonia channel protein AmtB
LQSWIEIITDPDHIFADVLMNIAFEVMFAWITYRIIVKMIIKRGKGKHRKQLRKTRQKNVL